MRRSIGDAAMIIFRIAIKAFIVVLLALWVFGQWWEIYFSHPYFTCWASHRTLGFVPGDHGFAAFVFDRYPGFSTKPTISSDWIPLMGAAQNPWIIPIWWLVVLMIGIDRLTGRKSRQRNRWAKQGRCLSCGYNLQGSESGTCSECGAAYEPSKPSPP